MSRARRPKAGFWIRLTVLVVYPLDSLLFRLRWHNLERIPAQGGVLLALNHISPADTLAAARLVWQAGRIPRFLIKSSVFGWPLVGRLMTGSQQIPVRRGTADAAQSLQAAIDALERGECVIIYPEGTITQQPDYWPMQGKTGIARLALMCPDVPVIPIGQWGAHRVLARGRTFRPFPRKLHQASIGLPLELDRFRSRPMNNAVLKEVTEEIMRAVTAEVAALRQEDPPAEQFPWTPSQHLKRAARDARSGK